ncbi:iron(3+)-hydroxamate-binding protein YxeB [Bacillus sp. J14TS2]|uniref:ABC transporter substrate-binding protein n=1 Tax=Bacillus sp. J14TS2 TaxID=2807188 RepID=UPI001B04F629|nr:ABC transporter substrate-binding protein [Bacillus sp. J14TS2]GIN72346.1 iron(3+)-hydroxamate-binding protein YxeB [Bacillus sp. J14TS2]
MKKLIGAITILSLLLLLGACGKAEESGQEGTEEETSDTRTIIDDAGREVEIPANPKRVVTDWYLGQLLALGIVPVGAPIHNLDYAEFLKQHYKEGEIEDIGDTTQSLEMILDLDPDVIVTWSEDHAKEYEKIAPTIVVSETAHETIPDEIAAMGAFLGRETEAKAFNQDFEKRITDAKEKIEDAIGEDATLTIYTLTGKEVYIVSDNSVNGGRALYTVLGRKPAPKVQELIDNDQFSSGSYQTSWETIGDFEGDYIFYIKSEETADDQVTWNNLKAIKNGHAIELPQKYYFASDALSVLHQAEDMAEKISALAKEEK